MEAAIVNGKLVLTLDIDSNPAQSKSGKSRVVSSSHGNQVTQAEVEYAGKKYPVVVGVNAYIKA